MQASRQNSVSGALRRQSSITQPVMSSRGASIRGAADLELQSKRASGRISKQNSS